METNQKELVARLRFDDKGLIPVIVQDAVTHRVLMMAYMNREALELSLTRRETYFWSRSRQALWHKGDTSGNRQKILKVETDCDSDTLLVSVRPMGPACHTGAQSCFYTNIAGETQEALSSGTSSSAAPDFHTTIERLVQVIKSRKVEMPEGSYTAYLFSKGIDKILKKIGEESAETIIAAKNKAKPELAMESADLLYHLLVLFVNEGLELEEVLEELERRANKGMAREE